MRGIRAEETAPVGSELLDRHKGRHRPARNGLHRAFKRMGNRRSVERHWNAAENQQQCDNHRNRQQHAECGPRQVHMEVVRLPGPAKPAGNGGQDRQTRGRADELKPHQPEYLRTAAHRGLSGIMLQVGIARE
ncbi:hypothetical protein SDC9_154384 [bioreactor metagenome]|uniref:Uncharacterized protein n=1 Tax=bioreactor metagenome TaxID=1076179 RepID=A0A645EYJ3_9ZZZZ